MNRRLIGVLAIVSITGPLLAACTEDEAPAREPVRPVLSMLVEAGALRPDGFAGSIEPRFTTDLSFRVLGRLVSRDVDLGDVVKKGQRIAAIDASTQELAVRASQSDLSRAEAQLENASANETRKRELLERNVGTRSDVDQAEQAREAADAAVVQARSALAKAREQLDYTQILSDMDGVVTAVSAEVGQQVTSGQTVATIANVDIREAVVDVPESEARKLKGGTPFTIGLQIHPQTAIGGTVREVAPEADVATGTRRVKITLDGDPIEFRVGTTITATPVHDGADELRVPRTAVLERDGKSFVWVLTPKTAEGGQGDGEGDGSGDAAPSGEATVSLKPVEIEADESRSSIVRSGIEPGTRIVTAGVHSLSEGQVVKLGEGLSL